MTTGWGIPLWLWKPPFQNLRNPQEKRCPMSNRRPILFPCGDESFQLGWRSAVSVCLQRRLSADRSTPAWPSFSSCLEAHPVNPSFVLVCVFHYFVLMSQCDMGEPTSKEHRLQIKNSRESMGWSWATSAAAAALPNLFAFRGLARRPVKYLRPPWSELHRVAWRRDGRWSVTGAKVGGFNGDMIITDLTYVCWHFKMPFMSENGVCPKSPYS